MYNVVVQWNVGNGDTHPQTQRTSDKRKKCRYWCKFLSFWYILYPGLIPDSVKVGRAPICRQEINRNKIIFKARISISSSCQCLHNPSCSFKCYSMYHSLSKIRPPPIFAASYCRESFITRKQCLATEYVAITITAHPCRSSGRQTSGMHKNSGKHHSEEEQTGSYNWDSSSLHISSHEDPRRQKKALGTKLVSQASFTS